MAATIFNRTVMDAAQGNGQTVLSNPEDLAQHAGAEIADGCLNPILGQIKRALRLIRFCLIQRSLSRALWVDEYENFIPRHGK